MSELIIRTFICYHEHQTNNFCIWNQGSINMFSQKYLFSGFLCFTYPSLRTIFWGNIYLLWTGENSSKEHFVYFLKLLSVYLFCQIHFQECKHCLQTFSCKKYIFLLCQNVRNTYFFFSINLIYIFWCTYYKAKTYPYVTLTS